MRKRVFGYLLNSIFLVVFNVYFFLLKDAEQPTSVWISYGVIHFAYLVLLLTPYFVRRGSSASDYSHPLFVVTHINFYVTCLIGLVVFVVSPPNHVVPMLVHLTVTAISAIVLFLNLIANENTADAVERRELELVYVKECSSKVKAILPKVPDKNVVRKLEAVYDFIRSSPARSSVNVLGHEREIVNLIYSLELAVRNKNMESVLSIADRILDLAEERNRILKLNY